MTRLASLALLLAAALALTACDSAEPEPDYFALELGTFSIEADGRTYQGEARYYERLESPTAGALVCAFPVIGSRFFMETDVFLTASPSDILNPDIDFGVNGARYDEESGSVEILEVTSEGIRGRLTFQLRDISIGPGAGGQIDVKGGFYAVRSEVGEGC